MLQCSVLDNLFGGVPLLQTPDGVFFLPGNSSIHSVPSDLEERRPFSVIRSDATFLK